MYDFEVLKEHANNIRKNIVKTVTEAKSGHPGGSLSSVEYATAIYFTQMDVNKDNLESTNRDRFVLSKGHASPLLYSVLAERGFIEEEELKTFRKINSRLQGHPSMRKLPGVDMSTGSLGQGLSVAVISTKEMLTVFIRFLVMGNAKKDRSGRLRWQLLIIS